MKLIVTLQARQEGSESLVFEDNDDDEVWDLESRVATQPLDLKGTCPHFTTACFLKLRIALIHIDALEMLEQLY